MTKAVNTADETLSRLIRYLSGLRAEYKVILPDGREFGSLVVVKPPVRAKRQSPTHPIGTIKAYLMPYLAVMQIGDTVQIPQSVFTLHQLQSGACQYATDLWGDDAVVTQQRPTEGCVEVLRVPSEQEHAANVAKAEIAAQTALTGQTHNSLAVESGTSRR